MTYLVTVPSGLGTTTQSAFHPLAQAHSADAFPYTAQAPVLPLCHFLTLSQIAHYKPLFQQYTFKWATINGKAQIIRAKYVAIKEYWVKVPFHPIKRSAKVQSTLGPTGQVLLRQAQQNVKSASHFITIQSYEPTIPYSIISMTALLSVLSYLSMLTLPVAATILTFPLLNSYILSGTVSNTEYLFTSLLLFILLEVLLFLAYFWWYYHNLSYSGPYSISRVSSLTPVASTYYLIAGLLLSLLSIYLSLTPVTVFCILASAEFSNVLDTTYINDNPFVSIQLTIVTLHLLHLLVGMILILTELSYPQYYHFIEVIWLLIGYCIYLE